ncbi:MAG TPA: hypothetical protein VK891_09990 [Euzebyales bacterium]|nr:hypothetical protein [Euzebyales bacterium]
MLQLLDWLTAVSSVALRMSVPADRRMASAGLDLDVIAGRLCEVHFFDTPDLTLLRSGIMLQARRTQRADDATVVRLRRAIPTTLSRAVRGSKNLTLELDVTLGAYTVSAALAGRRPAGAVRAAVSGARRLERLFTREQRAFFAEHAPAGVDWNGLVPLGPVVVVLLQPLRCGSARPSSVEQWYHPCEIPRVEVSTTVTPRNAHRVFTDELRFLRRHGVVAPAAQEWSTHRMVHLLARPLRCA